MYSCLFRAADWNLTSPDWRGRLKVVSKSGNCVIKLEDRNGGDDVETMLGNRK